jgi:hypothetical protein
MSRSLPLRAKSYGSAALIMMAGAVIACGEQIATAAHASASDKTPALVDHFLYSRDRQPGSVPVIHLRIPESAVPYQRGVVHVYALKLRVWYPALVAGADLVAVTKLPPKCQVHACEEEVMVVLGNRAGPLKGPGYRVEMLRRAWQFAIDRPEFGVSFEKGSAAYFDEVYIEKSTPARQAASGLYIRHKSASGLPLVVSCQPNRSYPLCEGHFWLNGKPEVEVTFLIRQAYLPDIGTIQSRLNAVLGSLVNGTIFPE